MSDTTLTLRDLNRALLARQLLLQREKITPFAVIERLAGLQAQEMRSPHIALWTRLDGYDRGQLNQLALSRKIVRATTMRATIHLLSAKDYLAWRSTLQAGLEANLQSIVGKRATAAEMEKGLAHAQAFFGEHPRLFEALRVDLQKLFGAKADIRAIAYAVRLRLPLVQIPTDHPWTYPVQSDFTLAEEWLKKKISAPIDREELVRRYLAAFGPATPGDATTWSGVRGLAETFAKLRPGLSVFRDERGRELFDLPKAPRPKGKVAAPVRILPEFDNMLLAHSDRTRIIAEEYRKVVSGLNNARFLATFTVDGFVAGTWRIERTKTAAELVLQPFDGLSAKAKPELIAEGKRLLRFSEPEAKSLGVKVGK